MRKVNLKEAFKGRKTPGEIKETSEVICEAIRDKKIKVEDLSIRNIAEATLGRDVVENQMMDFGIENLRESVDPVNLSAFSNITQVVVHSAAYEAYAKPEYIGSELVTEASSKDDKEQINALADIDDNVLEVAEGQEYPTMKFGEDFVTPPTSKKRGAKLGLTREMIFFDRTGQLTQLASALGDRMGKNKEVRILRVVLGVDNTFNRKGVARNTYVASADPRINRLNSKELIDWTSVDAVMQMFNDYVDDRTDGEPVAVTPDTMLVTMNKYYTAKQILGATEIRNITSSATIQTIGANPVPNFRLITSPWINKVISTGGLGKSDGIDNTTDSKDNWYVGQPKKAFRYTTLFPFAVTQLRSDKDEFERDVFMQWRVSERGKAWVWAPWYMIRARKAA